jgi:NAD(P)-dependent dehydrogenase (short-subunit alcohol dehydrogenase family)
MIFVRGAGSTIAQALAEFATICPVERGEQMPMGEKYLFCAGVLRQKPISGQHDDEVAESLFVNALDVIRECDRLLDVNPKARICVMGSEAGFTGSFDGAYAAAKAALHRYVETKRLKEPGQQLVCIAPTIICNTGMTNARNEDGVRAMQARQRAHPKRRWLEPVEVARMIHFLLCVDNGYTTNIVLRMNGGEHCR